MTKTEYADLIDVIRTESNPPLSYVEARSVANSVRRYAHKLDKIAERQCNGYPVFEGGRFTTGWDPVAAKKDEDLEAKIEERLATLGARHGLKFDTSGDPRGYVVKMQTPKTQRYNTWGGREVGWGIA